MRGKSGRATARELFGIDTRSLALFRVLLGGMILADLWKRGASLAAHYTDAGILPRAEIPELGAPPLFAFFHRLGGSADFQILLFGAAALLAVLLIAGWRTRAVTVLSFFLLMSLQQRNWLVLHAGDELLRFMVFWSMFLPLGERWSVDARRAPGPARGFVLSPGTVGLLLQVVFLYEVATISKLQYAPWLDGRAMETVLHKASYAGPLGTWLLQFPELLRLLTWGTLVVEGLGPLLLFSPWRTGPIRTATVLLFAYFQTGIWLTMSIGLFQPLAIVAMLPFLPRWFWDELEKRAAGSALRAPSANAAATVARPARWRRLPDAVAALALAYVTASNLLHLSPEIKQFPEPLRTVGETFLLDQRWRMFANSDATFQGWFAVVGTLPNGRPVNVLTRSSEISLDRPELYALTFPNHNWRIYWSRISEGRYAGFRPYLADWFCRDWNAGAPADLRLQAVEVIHVNEIVHRDRPVERRPVRLIRRACPTLES